MFLLGIWGMGGIGKTTIAKAIYNEIGRTFESRSFLSNIREVWGKDNGPVNLQQQLLSETCKSEMMGIRSIDSGKNKLKESLCHKRALVVLDDVNKDEQLNALFGSREWFGPGSRIIITTRDKHLLMLLKVDHVYIMKNMDRCESMELFSWHAFKQPSPKKGFIDLSRNIVTYSGGLPLALEVMGSYLFDREEKEWKSVLDKLKRIPIDEIQKKLKISFDGLNDDIEREIFLDISCFFIGMDRHDVTQILNASGFFADIGISVLVERSLVTVDENNKFSMHDLLRDMGREIIREKSSKEFGKRSRLWFHEDVISILSKHTGTKSVEGLALNLSQGDKVYFLTKAFKKMKTLRLLCLANVELDGDYKYISKDLKWLCWHKFPLEDVPANFFQNNLVAIKLKYSSLRLWRELQGLTLRDYGDDCVLPGDKYPYWRCFKGERASVKFKVPAVSCELKGITLCWEYYPPGDLVSMEFDSFISMLIINYTKMTTMYYRRDTTTSFGEAKWKEIISNLDSDDQVEITAVFGNGFTVKRTAVYLKYHESFDEQMEDPPSSSRELHRDDKNHDFKLKRQKIERGGG